jgi:hypothetical protein
MQIQFGYDESGKVTLEFKVTHPGVILPFALFPPY